VDAFKSAYLAVDRAQLEALLAPELSYGHATGEVETRQQFVDRLAPGVGVPRSIELSDRRVTLVGDDATVRHNFTAEAVNRTGQPVPIRISVMEVWQKRGGNWVMLAHQAYPRLTPK
jgi:ketosteroid isomerase-like protein